MRVARALVTLGPSSTADVATHLGFSTVVVGRHLDTLREAGWVASSEQAPYGPAALASRVRRRGRPARVWTLTPQGQRELAGRPEQAAHQLRHAVAFINDHLGAAGVRAFADEVGRNHVKRWRDTGVVDTVSLVAALDDDGYAAMVTTLADGQGQQLCQHNCPIRDVAQDHPEFCEAETRAISEVLGRNVVRLETISRGGHVCTTLIPNQPTRKEGVAI